MWFAKWFMIPFDSSIQLTAPDCHMAYEQTIYHTFKEWFSLYPLVGFIQQNHIKLKEDIILQQREPIHSWRWHNPHQIKCKKTLNQLTQMGRSTCIIRLPETTMGSWVPRKFTLHGSGSDWKCKRLKSASRWERGSLQLLFSLERSNFSSRYSSVYFFLF